jgi:septal ring factor EnvC (AmiA/AmiB activator)
MNKKIISVFVSIFLIAVFCLSAAWQNVLVQAQNEEAQIKSTYSAKKDKINENLKSTKSVIDTLKSSYSEATEQKKTYQEQKKANEDEIDKNNQALTDYKYAIAQLDDQIQTKEAEISTRKEKVAVILKQIWQERESSTIEVLLNSESFSQIITGLNQLSNLEDSLLENVKSLNEAKTVLEADRTQKLSVQKDLEDAQILLGANKQKLDALITEYANNEAKYESDIAKKEKEAKDSQDQLAQLQKEQESKLAEIRKRKEEELRKQAEADRLAKLAASGTSTGAVGSTNPNAKAVITQNSGTSIYGSCNSMTMPGVFPVKFGELATPTDGVLTQKYGSTSLSHSIYDCHNGVDFANSCGTSLMADGDGIVFASDYAAGGYGNFVVIEHDFGSKGKLYSLYGHMKSKTPLPIGSRVIKGDIVGYMGSTGFSTGCHLHYTLIDGESLIYDRNRAGSSPVGLYYNPLDYVSA